MSKAVFISYRSTERQQIQQLLMAIQQAGDYDVWHDQDIIGGQAWWDEIMAALERADIVVLALSPAYLTSEACRLELDYAQRLGKAILPVQIVPDLDYAQLGARLQRQQILRFLPVNPQSAALKQALQAVQPGTMAANTTRPEVPLSPLAEIQDVIAMPEKLAPAMQERVVDALRWHLRRQPDEAPLVIEMLNRLNARPEVIRQVSDEIISIINSDQPPRSTAKRQGKPGILRRLNEPWAMIGAALITAAATIAAVFIAVNLNGTPTTTPTPPDSSGSDSLGGTSVVATPIATSIGRFNTISHGPFDITLIYGARDSLTVLLNAESHLFDLTLNTPSFAESISESFGTLAAAAFVADTGTCLRYIREGTQPGLPRGCNPASTFEHVLPDADVFWFDDSSNQFQDIALRQAGNLIGLCPNAGGSGRCDFSP